MAMLFSFPPFHSNLSSMSDIYRKGRAASSSPKQQQKTITVLQGFLVSTASAQATEKLFFNPP